MKIIRSLFLVFTAGIILLACQKEIKFDDNGISAGTLVKDASGACLPVTVNGVYKVDTALTADNFVDVKINATIPGTFDIKSDTVNGYSFRKAGSVVFGANTIRLYASGKANIAGLNIFTIKYGTSVCTFSVTAAGSSAGTAVYTLGGAPGNCTGASAGGTFTAGTALTPSNTITIQVNVTQLGTYGIGATTGNGFVFSGSGFFTTLGLQNVVLTGLGTPTFAGATTASITNLAATCKFLITVQAGTGGGGTGLGYYFQFNDGTNLIAADTATVVALAIPNSGAVALSVNAFSITGDTSFSIGVTTTGNPATGVTYNTSNIGIPLTLFNLLNSTGQIYQADFSTPLQNIAVKFSVIDAANKVVEGTFSGFAKRGSNIATITNGKFRAKYQ